MKITRRQFLQFSGTAAGALLLNNSGVDFLYANETFYLNKKIIPDVWKKAVCRYCGTGCGMEIGLKDKKVVAVRGNKDYPVNKGILCLKGATLMYVVYSPERAFAPSLMNKDQFFPTSMENALSEPTVSPFIQCRLEWVSTLIT